ncbi:ester cyclase [Brevibacterium sp. VCM10]|uniref:ester cyclase n=1 Tax=Brevibacterium sp. VCM10 TaxID=1381751 RepID=UPI00046ED335|nr:ester cyclase [Brevibacterium sp. VCM10]
MIKEYLAAGDSGDEERLHELLDADIVTHSPGGGLIAGIDDTLQTWASAHRGLGALRHQVIAELHSGDLAAVRVRASGIHNGPFLGLTATGKSVSVDQALFARIAHGRIVEMWEIVDTGSGLRQLGMLPDGQPLGP